MTTSWKWKDYFLNLDPLMTIPSYAAAKAVTMTDTILRGGQKIYNVHHTYQCAESNCAIHNPSGHHMNKWHQRFRRGLMFRVCPHGLLHYDPDNPQKDTFFRDCALMSAAEHDLCCIDPRDLTIVDLTGIVQAMS